jgi:glycosyltransferase involved in cell wall biosynthesis
MKIVQVCPRYYPDIGGVETHVQEISERLAKRGFEVEVLCTDPTGKRREREVINGVSVRRFRSFAPNNAFFFAPQIYLHLKRVNCDLIHAHSYHALPAFFAAMAKDDRRFVFTPHYHGRGHTPTRNFLLKPYKFLGSKIFESADKVIFVSLYERRLAERDFDIPDKKIDHIINGINVEEFEKGCQDRDAKKILYIGRLEEYKGVQHIIEALPSLREYRLVIVGQGPYEEVLKKLAEDLGVGDSVEWLKNLSREDLLDHYRTAGIFVMLSSFEAFGITVAEALASGTPCIVATGSALEEFVAGKACVGIKRPINTNELAEKIEALSGKAISGSDLSREKIKSWDEVASQHMTLYKELLK